MKNLCHLSGMVFLLKKCRTEGQLVESDSPGKQLLQWRGGEFYWDNARFGCVTQK